MLDCGLSRESAQGLSPGVGSVDGVEGEAHGPLSALFAPVTSGEELGYLLPVRPGGFHVPHILRPSADFEVLPIRARSIVAKVSGLDV